MKKAIKDLCTPIEIPDEAGKFPKSYIFKDVLPDKQRGIIICKGTVNKQNHEQ